MIYYIKFFEGRYKDMMKKIFVPDSILRILERIGDVYERDLKIQIEEFEKFKAGLKNGNSSLLVCEEGKEVEAKMRLMYAIKEYYEPLCVDDIYRVENDVYIQEGLRERIERLSTESRTRKEALSILSFLKDAYRSSWGQGDSNYKIRDFRLVKTEDEFKRILDIEDAEELTAKKNLNLEFNSIQVGLVTMDSIDIYKKKKIFEDYQKFLLEHSSDIDFNDALEVFNLWHDVRETAIYYVYVPELKK